MRTTTGVAPELAATLAYSFPRYTRAEVAADRVLHLVALPTAVTAVAWLFLAGVPAGGVAQAIGRIVYGYALIGMLTASAAYNLSHPSRRKELLRRVDHAMIFVMIAGTYTPFTLLVFEGDDGVLLCLLIWSLAATGIAAILAFPRRFERSQLALYLIMGWAILGIGRRYMAYLSIPVLCLVVAGGAAYTVGTFVHARCHFRFYNVVWHGLVLLGAGLHWLAVAQATPQTDVFRLP